MSFIGSNYVLVPRDFGDIEDPLIICEVATGHVIPECKVVTAEVATKYKDNPNILCLGSIVDGELKPFGRYVIFGEMIGWGTTTPRSDIKEQISDLPYEDQKRVLQIYNEWTKDEDAVHGRIIESPDFMKRLLWKPRRFMNDMAGFFSERRPRKAPQTPEKLHLEGGDRRPMNLLWWLPFSFKREMVTTKAHDAEKEFFVRQLRRDF